MKLSRVFLLGFLASVGTVGALIWAFAAYEAKDLIPFFHSPRMSQETWFEIIRNAVTTGAALGVGVTLFFSYRRQQTAEETQRIGAEAHLTASKAQETAAKALELANKQHGLDQDRRRDSVTAELRSRYVKTAEQLGSDHLAIKLAGIYSLAALADDWAEIGNHDERQVCIDLLAAYFRSAHPLQSDVRTTTLDVLMARLQGDTPEKKYWGRSSITLTNPGEMPSIKGITLREGGQLTISQASKGSRFVAISRVVLDGGSLSLENFLSFKGTLHVGDATLSSGKMRLSLGSPAIQVQPEERGSIVFRRVTLDGSDLTIVTNGHAVKFIECVFNSGNLFVSAGDGPVLFRECRFEGNVFERADWMGSGRPVSTTVLAVENCSFRPSVPILEPHSGLASPES